MPPAVRRAVEPPLRTVNITVPSRPLLRSPREFLCDGLSIRVGQLFGSEVESQLVDGAGEAERQLVAVVYCRARIAANVKGLIDGHEQWNRVIDLLASQFLAIDRKHAGAAFPGTWSVVFEVEHDSVLARRESIRG